MESYDLYKILGVTQNSSKQEIRESYKKLVIKWHPDKNRKKIAGDMFKKIQIAYEILSDDKKREQYDNLNKNDDLSKNDNLGNNLVKFIFIKYYEIILEICNKYHLSESDKTDILALFDPIDYKESLDTGDLNDLNNKIMTKIVCSFPNLIIKDISTTHPHIGSFLSTVFECLFY